MVKLLIRCQAIFILISISNLSYSQSKEIPSWEVNEVKESSLIDGEIPYKMLYLNSKIFGIWIKDREYYITSYSDDLEWLNTNKIELDEFSYYTHFKIIGERLYFVYQKENSDDLSSLLFLQEINQNTLEKKGDPVVLVDKQFDDEDRYYESSIMVSFNDDKRLLSITEIKVNSEGKRYLEVSIYDSDFQLLNTIEGVINGLGDQLRVHETKIINEDSVFFRYLHMSKKDKSWFKNANHGIGRISGTSIDFTYEIDTKGYYFQPEKIYFSNDSNPMIIEGYKDKKDQGFRGVYYLKLNGESGEVMAESFLQFEQDYLLLGEGKDIQRLVEKDFRKDKFTAFKEFKDLEEIQFSDNSTLICKDHFTTSEINVGQRNSFGVQTTNTETIARNFHLWLLDSKGQMRLATKYVKYRNDESQGTTSFAFRYRDYAYLLYVEVQPDVELKQKDYPYSINMVRVDSEGNILEKSLNGISQDAGWALLDNSALLDDDKLIIPYVEGEQYKLKAFDLSSFD